MRLYKSPQQQKPNMQKKSAINFVKNVAAPRTLKTQQIYNSSPQYHTSHHRSQHLAESSHLMDRFKRNAEFVNLIIKKSVPLDSIDSSKKIQVNEPSKNVRFGYDSQTEIRNLTGFVQEQIGDSLVYLKSSHIYVDYILNLKEYKVKDLVGWLKDEKLEEDSQTSTKETDKGEIDIEITCCPYSNIYTSNPLKNFQLIKCVGSGGFSKVYLVRGFGKLMAMKVINKEYILQNDKANIITSEKAILSSCSEHPFITTLHCSFETDNFLFFIMEFCNGGELFNLLRKVRRMKENDAKFYFLETLSAIVYLHQKGIVYRDIKPENIIIDYQGHVRLADYGLSKMMNQEGGSNHQIYTPSSNRNQNTNRDAKTYSFCGSAEYMAPEMLLKKGHSFEIDFYCLGALLYELVIGLPPYYSRDQNELFANIIHNDLEFPSHVNLSEEVKSFLHKMLQKQVAERYNSIEQIMSDPWLQTVNLNDVVCKKLEPPFKTDMFDYNFDDSDFAEEEKETNQLLRQQQQLSSLSEPKFADFFYESKELTDLKRIISNSKQEVTFLRSNKTGQFTVNSPSAMEAQIKSREISSQSNSVIIRQSREPSINRVQQPSSPIAMSQHLQRTSSSINNNPSSPREMSRFINMQQSYSQPYQENIYNSAINSPNSSQIMQQKVSYFQHGSSPLSKPLSAVRSAGQIQNRAMVNRSNDNSVGSIKRVNQQHQRQSQNIKGAPTSNATGNIYTQKPFFNPVKATGQCYVGQSPIKNNINGYNPYSHSHTKSASYIKPSTSYLTKPNSNNTSARKMGLDIQTLNIKNQRNMSVDKVRDIYSSQQHSQSSISRNHKSINHSHTNSYDLKKGFLQSFKEKFLAPKVKKSSMRNGEKISVSLLNNMHYRH